MDIQAFESHTPSANTTGRSIAFILLATLFTLTILFSSIASAKATLYKKIDKDGNVILTDKPIPGSKPITVDTNRNLIKTVKPRVNSDERLNSDDEGEEESEAFRYDSLTIVTPLANAGVRANDGNVQVRADIKPRLREGHSLRLLLDGQPVGSLQKIPYFSLNEVSRGEHQLELAVVEDATGIILQSGEPRLFHVLKAQIKNRKKRRR